MKKIETLKEYQELAERTLPDLGSIRKNLIHMEAGIMGELFGEALDVLKKNFAYGKPIDKVHLGEEIADTIWYIAGTFTIMKPVDEEITLEKVYTDNVEEFRSQISVTFGGEEEEIALKDLLEREQSERILALLLSNKDTTEVGEPKSLIACIVICQYICDIFDIDFWQSLTNNIEKLQVRYPEKYTDEAAINRNIGVERLKLEQTGE